MKYTKYIIGLFVVVLIVGALIVPHYQSTTYNNTATSTPPVSGLEKAIKEVMNREEFQRKAYLNAKKTALEEEKAKLVAEHEASMAEIENELELIRADELSFQ